MELATHTSFVPQGVPPTLKSLDWIGPKARRPCHIQTSHCAAYDYHEPTQSAARLTHHFHLMQLSFVALALGMV